MFGLLSTGHCSDRATTQDGARQEGETQQALASLASQQPISLELHGKLAKAALQAGATAAAMQAATALVAAGLPQGRAVQDILDPAKAPRLTAADWLWLSVAAIVLGQEQPSIFSPFCPAFVPAHAWRAPAVHTADFAPWGNAMVMYHLWTVVQVIALVGAAMHRTPCSEHEAQRIPQKSAHELIRYSPSLAG